jgi:hypothetical protein
VFGPIGRTPDAHPVRTDRVNAEPLAAGRAVAARARAAGQAAAQPTARASTTADPLTSLQWEMRMVKADQAHLTNNGSRRVLVGIIDSVDVPEEHAAGAG